MKKTLANPDGLGLSIRTMNNDTITAKIESRTFTFTAQAAAGPLDGADMIAKGWEPIYFLGVGIRGATFLAYRSRRTGEFVRVCKV